MLRKLSISSVWAFIPSGSDHWEILNTFRLELSKSNSEGSPGRSWIRYQPPPPNRHLHWEIYKSPIRISRMQTSSVRLAGWGIHTVSLDQTVSRWQAQRTSFSTNARKSSRSKALKVRSLNLNRQRSYLFIRNRTSSWNTSGRLM